ncbi:MAG: hypothetical protein HWQ38_18880 [Nostoc sp. NMS7]|uniref:hypothetical protein n=1 Tax=Nostoc sp. NMS7 TaxID=2815391 RepID=UPI0025D99F52|nr:hypothetical protein [Nostoc sp. NMS7]MBN3948401.1 hypothetical protein [Nostoc sp. NMS7]
MDITPFIKLEENAPPQDGTWLLLLVRANKDDWHPTEDNEVFRTIGFNDRDANGDDTWRCVGWDWCHDGIVETTGEVIGWMYMPELSAMFTTDSA